MLECVAYFAALKEEEEVIFLTGDTDIIGQQDVESIQVNFRFWYRKFLLFFILIFFFWTSNEEEIYFNKYED